MKLTDAEKLQDIRDRIELHYSNVRILGDEMDMLSDAEDTIEDILLVIEEDES